MLVVSGAVFAVLVSGVFGIGERFRQGESDASLVERVCMGREAEARLAELASDLVRLAERERMLESFLSHGQESVRRRASEVLHGRILREFWGDFARASWLVKEDPVSAVAELRLLRLDLRECLRMVGEVLDVSTSGADEVLVKGDEAHG